jgi:hypothetical protein
MLGERRLRSVLYQKEPVAVRGDPTLDGRERTQTDERRPLLTLERVEGTDASEISPPLGSSIRAIVVAALRVKMTLRDASQTEVLILVV